MSVSLNLRSPEGQELLLELVADADVLIENFRPGTLEKWGIGPDALLERNPQLVIARVSGYGQTGPYAGPGGFRERGRGRGWPAASERISRTSHLPGPASRWATRWPACSRFRGSWRHSCGGWARASEAGQVIDATITESCFALLEGAITEYNALGVVRGPSGTGLRNVAPSNIYPSREGSGS